MNTPSQLCYTIESAAERLGISETVLVRLSQFFKMPANCYEENGFLSFKGDLSFTEGDIQFFRQARERLLAGESLEQVRRYFQENPLPQTPIVQAETSTHYASAPRAPQKEKSAPSSPAQALPLNPEITDTVTVGLSDSQPVKALAKKTFEHYKESGTQPRQGVKSFLKRLKQEIQPEGDARVSSDLQGPLSPAENNHTPLPIWDMLIEQARSQAPSLSSQLKDASVYMRQACLSQWKQTHR